MFLIAEKQQKIVLNFSLDSFIVTEYTNNRTPENIEFIEQICNWKLENFQ